MKGLLKSLAVSQSAWPFAIIFVVSVVALCATLIFGVATGWDGTGSEEELDAAGLEQNAAAAADNYVNPSQMPDTSFIYDISIEELASADFYMDAQTVQVIGEVVGDRIYAEDDPSFCWIVLQSTGMSDAEVSVYMPVTASEVIDTYGAYGKRGTRLQVSGIFNLACRDHHGTSEIHASDVAFVEKGEREEMPFEPRRMILGLVLVMIGSAAMLAYNVLSERER